MRSRFSVAVWIGQSTSVKPLSLVLNRDRDFSVSSATARHVNALVMILPVAVDYGIFQRLIERYLNVFSLSYMLRNFPMKCMSRSTNGEIAWI